MGIVAALAIGIGCGYFLRSPIAAPLAAGDPSSTSLAQQLAVAEEKLTAALKANADLVATVSVLEGSSKSASKEKENEKEKLPTTLPPDKGTSPLIPPKKMIDTPPAAKAPELKQTVKSIRVVLAENLAVDSITAKIREKYEPLGIKVATGKPSPAAPLDEDVLLVGTFFESTTKNFSGGTDTNTSANYLWITTADKSMRNIGFKHRTVSGGFSDLFSVNPINQVKLPLLVYDPSPLIDLKLTTQPGIPTDDLKYVLSKDKKTIVVFDVAKGAVATKHETMSEWSNQLTVGTELMSAQHEKGFEVFDISGLPTLGAGKMLFPDLSDFVPGKPERTFQSLALVGRNVVVLVDGRLHVIHCPKGGEPSVVFKDDAPAAELRVTPAGKLRLYASKSSQVRQGTLEPGGKVQFDAAVDAGKLPESDEWLRASSGRLEVRGPTLDNVAEIWWREAPDNSRHLVDLHMGSHSTAKIATKTEMPVFEQGFLLGGLLLAMSGGNDEGIRKLPNGSLVIYRGGTIVRLKHFPW